MDESCYECRENMIDENVARLNAGFVLILSLLYIFTSYKFALVILVFDFFVKVFAHPRYAPTSYFARYILHSFAVKPKFIFAPPKLFAVKIGLGFALMTFVLYLMDFETISYFVCGILAIFSALEVSFKFCVGCWAYSNYLKNHHEGS